eukprot:scaffold16111_cov152-Skeletonema_dohrnii-CCMP3373.AAC.11
MRNERHNINIPSLLKLGRREERQPSPVVPTATLFGSALGGSMMIPPPIDRAAQELSNGGLITSIRWVERDLWMDNCIAMTMGTVYVERTGKAQ